MFLLNSSFRALLSKGGDLFCEKGLVHTVRVVFLYLVKKKLLLGWNLPYFSKGGSAELKSWTSILKENQEACHELDENSFRNCFYLLNSASEKIKMIKSAQKMGMHDLCFELSKSVHGCEIQALEIQMVSLFYLGRYEELSLRVKFIQECFYSSRSNFTFQLLISLVSTENQVDASVELCWVLKASQGKEKLLHKELISYLFFKNGLYEESIFYLSEAKKRYWYPDSNKLFLDECFDICFLCPPSELESLNFEKGGDSGNFLGSDRALTVVDDISFELCSSYASKIEKAVGKILLLSKVIQNPYYRSLISSKFRGGECQTAKEVYELRDFLIGGIFSFVTAEVCSKSVVLHSSYGELFLSCLKLNRKPVVHSILAQGCVIKHDQTLEAKIQALS